MAKLAWIVGAKVRVVGNRSGSAFAIGSEGKLSSKVGTATNTQWYLEGNSGSWIYQYDLELITASTKADIEKEIEGLKTDIKTAESKLEYMGMFDVDTVDDKEFRVWRTLQLVNQKGLPEKERVRLIAALI